MSLREAATKALEDAYGETVKALYLTYYTAPDSEQEAAFAAFESHMLRDAKRHGQALAVVDKIPEE